MNAPRVVKTPKPWTTPGEAKPPPPPKQPRPEPGRRAREWKRMLDEGVYENQSELARGEGVSAAAVSRGLQKRRRPANPYRRAPGAPLHWGAASHDLEVALRSPGSVGVPAYGANSS